MENKPSCYNCAYLQDGLRLEPHATISGFMCYETMVDHFYPEGLPQERICNKHRRKSGISIKDKYPDEVPAYRLMMKEKGFTEETIETWLLQDSATIERECC